MSWHSERGLRVEKVIHVTVFGDETVDVTAFHPSSSTSDANNNEVRLVTPDEAVEFVRAELCDTKLRWFGETLTRARRVLSNIRANDR